MKKAIKKIKKLMQQMGFDIVSSKKDKLSNRDLIEHDIKVMIPYNNPLIFDVGANKGQSINGYKRLFKEAVIYSFEPNPGLFKQLQETYKENSDIHLNSVALGEKDGNSEFIIFENNELSSFKAIQPNVLNPFSATRVESTTVATISTLDTFVAANNIKEIDLLKIDTQGYELEILRGSIKSLQAGIIKNIYLELSFIPLYKDQSNYLEVISLLQAHHYQLVGLYEMHRTNKYLEWTNGLFTRVGK